MDRFKTGMRVEGAATPSLSETYNDYLNGYASVYNITAVVKRLLRGVVLVAFLGESIALTVVIALAIFAAGGAR